MNKVGIRYQVSHVENSDKEGAKARERRARLCMHLIDEKPRRFLSRLCLLLLERGKCGEHNAVFVFPNVDVISAMDHLLHLPLCRLTMRN